ncbi:hypothetical protein EAF04_002444 [Stromatinia cepivora]|nr:hypothetical protein EAF04_002444 [Stromatinia cepivora]
MENGKQNSSGDGSDEYVRGTSPNTMRDLTSPSQDLTPSASSHTSFTPDLILPTTSGESSLSNGSQNVAPTRLNHTSETSDSRYRTVLADSSSGVEGLETTDERTLRQISQQTRRRGEEEELEDGHETREEQRRPQKRKLEEQEKMHNGGSPSGERSLETIDEQISRNRSEGQYRRRQREKEDPVESPETRVERLRLQKNVKNRRYSQRKKGERENVMNGDDMAKKMSFKAKEEQERLQRSENNRKYRQKTREHRNAIIFGDDVARKRSLEAKMEQERLRNNESKRRHAQKKKEKREMLEEEEMLAKLKMQTKAKNRSPTPEDDNEA